MNVKTETLTELNALMKQNGFRWRKPTEEFYRNTEHGRLGFFVIFSYLSSGRVWTLRTVAMIRSNDVEKIFHKFSGFDHRYHRTSYTIGCSLEEYTHPHSNTNAQLELHDDSEIQNIALELFAQFCTYANPYFAKYDGLAAMDRLLNDEPEKNSIHGGAENLRCERGLILAKLSGRSDYPVIEQTYRAKMEKLNGGFYLPAFDAIAKFLRGL
jgi:hypothetical protein